MTASALQLQVLFALIVLIVLCLMLVRMVSEFLLMFRDVVDRARQRRWEANLWRDVGKQLSIQRRSIKTRRRTRV